MLDVPHFPGRADDGPRRCVHALVRALGGTSEPYEARPDGSTLVAFAAAMAADIGHRSEAIVYQADDVDRLLASGQPFVFIPLPGEDRAYAVVRSDADTATFLHPLGHEVVVDRRRARAALVGLGAGRLHELAQSIATRVAAADAQRQKLADAMSTELLDGTTLGWGLVFRAAPVQSLTQIAGRLKLVRFALLLLVLSLAQSALTAAAWWLIGTAAIDGQAERSGILGWCLLTLTVVVVQVVTTRYVGRFTIRAAYALRQHLVDCALLIEPDELSSFGFGGLMVVASQSDAFLGTAITTFVALLGFVTNLTAAAAVLVAAPKSGLSLALLFSLLVGLGAVTGIFAARSRRLLEQRVRLTTDMVERMLGHRTRLVQQTVDAWHSGEDESLVAYAERSWGLDRGTVTLRAVPRAYYLVSVVALFMVLGAHPTQGALALSVAGMGLGMGCLAAGVELVISGSTLSALWSAVRPLTRVQAFADARPRTAPSYAAQATESLVELKGVHFAYPTRPKPILSDARLAIRRGDRLLIEGPSGGGKTTLATLISGLRRPDAGRVVLRGLDHHTIQERDWRRIVAIAPQFYRNHIFSESLAFNVLVGRCWPAAPEDLRDATDVLTSLGLGPLLERMPGGLFQHVGDTGWQLSHGEKSRVYLARTILQRSDVILLDETFGALDPDALRECMRVLDAAAGTLVVITHR